MIDEVDLFADAPPLKRCDGCGRYFEEADLKRCRVCGEYFCPECRKTHDCRIKPDTQKAETPIAVPVSVIPSSAVRESVAASPVQPVMPRTYNEQPVAYPDEMPPEEQPVQSDELQCSRCGGMFQKSALRQCRKCGAILCAECQPHHKCPPKKKEKKEPATYARDDEDIAEPNLLNDKKERKNKLKKEKKAEKLAKKQGKKGKTATDNPDSFPKEDYYDPIMNYKGKGNSSKKKFIILGIIGVIVIAALVFLALNLFGVLTIIPGISGALAGIGGGSVVGTWNGTYNGISGSMVCNGDHSGYISSSSSGFLGIPGYVTTLTWSDDGGGLRIAAPMSDISASGALLQGNTLTVTMLNGSQVLLTRA